jgi:predicted dehydrogenase
VAIQVAVAGLGRRGSQWAREVQAHPGYELAACAHLRPEALERVCRDLGVPPGRRFTRLEQAVDSVPCDAVIIATSAERHVEPCEVALSRGLGVLVEKPFTTRLDEAVGLVALGEARGAPLVVGQNFRYLRAQRAVRGIVRDGVLGRIGMAVCRYYNIPENVSRSVAKARNSILFGAAVHHIDALPYVLGKRATGVMADGFTTPWSRPPDGASVHALLTLEGGIHAIFTATYESFGHEFFERGREYYQRFVGERGTLHVFHRWLVLCERGKRPRIVRRGPRHATEEAVLLDELQAALLYGQEPESSGRANLQTMATLEAFVRSAAEKRWLNPQDLLAASA